MLYYFFIYITCGVKHIKYKYDKALITCNSSKGINRQINKLTRCACMHATTINLNLNAILLAMFKSIAHIL